MGRIKKSIELRASPEKIWEMLALDRLPEWMDVLEMKSGKYISEVHTRKDKYKVGATAHIIEHVKYDLEITESLENEKMAYRFEARKISMIMTYILAPTD